MAAYVNANNAFSTLAGNMTASDTSFTLSVGASFPIVVSGNWTFVTFQDAANNIEIVKVTAHGDGTNSFTCVRAQEGTEARAWIAGDICECRFTAGITVTTDKVQTLTNKTFDAPNIKFADGTAALPGIAWANEPSTGFTRLGATVMAAIINGTNNMHWQPGHTFCNTVLDLHNGSALNFYSSGNAALWEVLHANSANTFHVGRIGWASTTIYGGGAGNVLVHGGGVNLYGNVTGVTAAMVGLSNVANHRQVYELRNGGAAIYIGWNGSQLDTQVNSTYFGGTWPISVSGSSGSCSGNAGTASTAANALNICNIGGWRYANEARNPVYLWATDGNTQDNFLVQPGNLSVNYANSCNYANGAGYANTAGNANALGGQGPNSFLRSSDGSISNMKVWQDGNDAIWLEIATNRGFNAVGNNPTFSYAVNLFNYGPTMDELTGKVAALEARLAALEAH